VSRWLTKDGLFFIARCQRPSKDLADALEAGMISTRTKAALQAAKARGRTLGGPRVRKSDGKPVIISRSAQKTGAAANHLRAVDLAPTLAQIQADGAVTLKDIAAALDAAGIATPPRSGQMEPGSG
jgi:DNA invertase Pin-like site-specific DNA recombinase